MSSETARRESILQAAIGVFLRYGYKKTSMDDLARAADLSRQGLYLHFATKEALFKASVLYVTQQCRVVVRAALGREELPIEERLLGAFVALKTQGEVIDLSQEHMVELFAAAAQLVGPVIEEMEQSLVVDLARVIHTSGVAAKWKDDGLSAKDLAFNLYAASHGAKHYVKTIAEYKERMRVAIHLACRTPKKR